VSTAVRILFCGEAWGAQEDAARHPLVGPSGREFAYMLSDSGIAPELRCSACRQPVRSARHRIDCGNRFATPRELIAHWAELRTSHGIALTNVFNERPPGNALGHFFTRARESTLDLAPMKAGPKVGRYLQLAAQHHIERLWQEVTDLRPNLVVALGNAACWALIDQTSIGIIRGAITYSGRLQQKVLPTYHPAAVMRQWPLRTTVLQDLTKALRESQFPEVRRVARWHTLYPTLEDIAQWLAAPATRYSVDIETLIGQISIVGFARSETEAIVIPFVDPAWLDIYYETERPPLQPMHYWPDAQAEARAWELVRSGLEKPGVEKVGQNFIYDLSYFLRLGIKPSCVRDDTMLKHHALFPELPKGLGFLGSVYTDEVGAWKLMNRPETYKRDD
jgi:uracil-DNA glycosylase